MRLGPTVLAALSLNGCGAPVPFPLPIPIPITEESLPSGEGQETQFSLIVHDTSNQAAIEADAKSLLTKALQRQKACINTVLLFKSDPGAYPGGLTDIINPITFLKTQAQCQWVQGGTMNCVIVAYQYDRREMINGFTVTGSCAPGGETISAEQILEGFSLSLDLSERLKERVILKAYE